MAKKEILKEKTRMPIQKRETRVKNFNEVALGYTKSLAIKEAQRCIQCKNKPCIKGCPVEVQIPKFISLILEERFGEALQVITQSNMLPGICGRVCPQENQCEAYCALGRVKGSTPVAIGRLERFVADWDLKNKSGRFKPIEKISPNLKKAKVAVIGSGPAGLTCASDLAIQGYEVSIFEAFHAPGGVLIYGIPEFRLPKRIVEAEVEKIKSLGVSIVLNNVIGKTHSLSDLRESGFKAFFVGVGAGLPAFPNIPGINYNGVLSANEYLTRVNLMKAYDSRYDTLVDYGKFVAVIGGGNVAMDAARTSLRLGAEKTMIIYRRSEKELPARREEYEHAVEEGIEFHLLRNPTSIIGDREGFVKAIKLIEMELGQPDSSGRQRPIAKPGTEYKIECDLVIIAVGAKANPLFTKNTPGLALNKWGYIEVNEYMQTSIPDVFAGGDIVTGAATVISAMGAGREAARGIRAYLNGELPCS